jgi:hypothetical protein
MVGRENSDLPIAVSLPQGIGMLEVLLIVSACRGSILNRIYIPTEIDPVGCVDDAMWDISSTMDFDYDIF